MGELKYLTETISEEKTVHIYLEKGMQPVWYQFEMIASNPEVNLTAPMYIQRDEENILAYTVGDKMTLKEFLINHEVTSRDICEIIRNIASNIMAGREYLLDERGYLLNEDLIFLYNGIEDIRVLYIPVNQAVCAPDILQELILRIITSYAMIIPGEEYFLTQLLNFMKNDKLSFCDIFEFCDALLRRNPETQAQLQTFADIHNIPDESDQKDSKGVAPQFILAGICMAVIFTPVGNYIDFYGVGKNLLLGMIIIAELLFFFSKRAKIR